MSRIRPQTVLNASYDEYLTRVRGSKQNFFKQTKFNPYWQRFGLFSYCPSYSGIDTRYNLKKPRDRNEDGTIKLGQKNFNTDPLKKGTVFSKPGFLCVGDAYEDQFRMYDQEKKENQQKQKAIHSNAFKPNGQFQKIIGTGYEHFQDYNHKVYDNRNPDGSVKKGRANFKCGPAKKGNSCYIGFQTFPEYKLDPYENSSNIAKKSYEELYGEVQTTTNKQKIKDNSWMAKHQKAFIPNNPAKKSTINKTFQQFPQYLEEGELENRPKSAQGKWIQTHNWKTRPTPSIMQNFRNSHVVPKQQLFQTQ